MTDVLPMCRNCFRCTVCETTVLYDCRWQGVPGSICNDRIPRFVYALVAGDVVIGIFDDRDDAVDELEHCCYDGSLIAVPQEGE